MTNSRWWFNVSQRQFKTSPVRHQCISTLFKLPRLMTHHHQKKFQNNMQWLNRISNYDGPWLITTNRSRCQNNYSSILFTINIVRDSSSQISQEYCSTRTIIQEQSKVHYYSTLSHFWHDSNPSSTRGNNNSRLSASSYQHKTQSLSSICLLLIPCCIL